MTIGMDLLNQANKVREKGDPLKSLQLADEATLELQKEGNLPKMAEAQAVRYLALKHLAGSTGDKVYFYLAKQATASAVEIAETCEDKTGLAIPYVNLAKAYLDLEQYDQAVIFYKKALENQINNPSKDHNRAGVVADFKIHLAEAEYLAGDKTAIDRLIKGISDLDASDEKEVSIYNYHVWKSGAYMSAAKLLKEDKPESAKEYLEKAKEIIDADPALKVRKTQWEKLAERFLK